jgi:alpha-1,3-rhamnosyl/mannosyltransferase
LTRPFFLCVGTIEPRKNFDGAVRAYGLLPSDLRESFDLVIAGGRGWREASFHEAVERSPVRNRIRLVGPVTDETLRALYNQAAALIVCSHYEGFGLPIVEAMACGCPVIGTKVSAIPEVAGDAGLLVPPGSDDALATAMAEVARDSTVRDRLRQLGAERAKQFRAGPIAARVLELLQAS